MRLELQQHVGVPRTDLWRLLTTWERQPDWMVDALAVTVRSRARTGVGVTIVCPTRLLGITVDDVMRVTAWEDEAYLEVVHLGSVITGRGAFELADAPGGGTTLTWWEEVDPPLGAFGEVAATLVVRPVTERIFRRSLRNLARLAEREAAWAQRRGPAR